MKCRKGYVGEMGYYCEWIGRRGAIRRGEEGHRQIGGRGAIRRGEEGHTDIGPYTNTCIRWRRVNAQLQANVLVQASN